MAKFKVVREHYGDRHYMPGDVREVSAADVAHLVPSVLAPLEIKAEPSAPLNKAEDAAPANKAAHGRKAKHGDDE